MDSSQFSESDFKKFMLFVKSEMQQICSGADIKKNSEKIIEWYNSAPHRITKLLCYPLLKSLQNVDLSAIFTTISQDLVSKDVEIQLNTMKLMYLMGHEQALEILKNNQQQFFELLKNSEFHYERLTILHDFLIKAYLKNFQSEDDCREQIINIYLSIADQIFQNVRDITRNSIEVFISLFNEYLNNVTDFNAIDHYFDGNGSVQNILKPLILRITNYFVSRIESLLQKIISYEVRLRSNLIKLIVYLIEVILTFTDNLYGYHMDSISSQFLKEEYKFKNKYKTTFSLNEFFPKLIEKHIIQDILMATHELDVLTNAYLSTFRLLNISENHLSLLDYHKRCQITWDIFLHFIKMVNKNTYRKEYNVILINIAALASKLNNTAKITISMKVLEIVCYNITHQFNRFFLMLICFLNMIQASMDLLALGKRSCIFSLFSQPWFLNKIKADQEDLNKDQEANNNNSNLQIKEELLIGLTISAIHARVYLQESPNYQFLDKIMLEVIDVSYRIINWKYISKQSSSDIYNKTIFFAIDVFLILLEECISFLDSKQISTHIEELIKRVNLNEMNFLPKLKCLFLLCKNQDKEACTLAASKIDTSLVLNDFRQFLIQKNIPSFFYEKYFDNAMNLSEINKYLSHLEYIFTCLYYFASQQQNGKNSANIPGSPEIKGQILNLLEDFKNHLNELSKQKGSYQQLITAISQFLETLQAKILDDYQRNPQESMTISKQFLENIDLEPVKKPKLSQDPRDLLYLAFNSFNQSICKNRSMFISDSVESENPMKTISSIFLKIQSEQQMNANYKMNTSPKLISGLADCVQIYASHSTFVYKSLLSINLKVFNQTQFKIDQIKIRVLHSNGVAIFPKESNPKQHILEELNPLNVRNISFSLNVNTVESQFISFEIFVGEVRLKTLPYKVNMSNFIIPNYINVISKHIFHNVWSDLGNIYQIQGTLNISFKELQPIIVKSKFSCVILEGMAFKGASKYINSQTNRLSSSPYFTHRNKEEEDSIDEDSQRFLTVGMLGLTWDGVSIAICVSGIKNQNHQSSQFNSMESNVKSDVLIEFRASKNCIIDIIKYENTEIIQDIFQHYIHIEEQ
ncbi:hypothetical protein ABPG72_006435 [Tetrahymena utriculariae]